MANMAGSVPGRMMSLNHNKRERVQVKVRDGAINSTFT